MTAEALGVAGYRVVRAHRVERARAQARLLSTLGLFPDTDAPSPLDR